jgi:hypothetical protein
MRFQVEIRPDKEDRLRRMATDDRRSVREQASYFLDLKIQEEADRRALEPTEPVADSVAA